MPVTPDLTTQAGWNAFVQEHGGIIGTPTAQLDKDKQTGDPVEAQDPFYEYRLGDGTVVEVNNAGNVRKLEIPKASTTTADKPSTYDVEGVGRYEKQPDGSYKLVVAAPSSRVSNPDEDMLTAIKRQGAEAERNERQANAAAGRGYMTSAEAQAINLRAQQLGLDANAAKLARDKFEQDRKYADEQERRAEVESRAGVARTQAQTGQIITETDLTRARIEELQRKTPAEIAEMEARGELTRAQAEKARQEMRKPDVVPGSSELSHLTTITPEGQVRQDMNMAFRPQTVADVAARVGQLQAAAQAKRAEVSKKIGVAGYTAEQAVQEFNGWWDQNVEPQRAQLEAAQQEAQAARGRQEAEASRMNVQAAQGAGRQAIDAFQAQARYRVGPRAAEVANQAARGQQYDLSNAAFYQAPNLDEVAQQRTMEALKWISPTAAAATGGPMPQVNNIDVTGGLNRTSYMPGMPAPSPVMGGAAPAPAPPGPGWMRADQMFGAAPPGNAMAPGPGMAGVVRPGSPVSWPPYQFPG
jgi:hypothetical protein